MSNTFVPNTPATPIPREAVISVDPFVVRRRVVWAECDPAGVVYTPRFGDFAADAGQLFLAYVFGGKGYVDGKQKQNIGTPCKALSLVFHSSLKPDDAVDMTVVVGRIGTTSFELVIDGKTPDGTSVFECSTTLIAVKAGTREAVPLTSHLRQLLQARQPQPRNSE